MAEKIGPNSPCPCGSGKKYKKCCGAPGVARAAMSRAVPAATLIQQGKALQQSGRPDEAAGKYLEALAQDPRQAEALCLLGTVERARRNLPQAADLLAKAVSIDGDNPVYLYNLASVLIDANALDRAVPALRRATALKPDYTKAHIALGIALHRQEKFEEASTAFRAAVRLEPRNVQALSNLGSMLREMGRLGEARDCLEKALRLAPDIAEIHNNLGETIQGEQGYEAALPHYEKALALQSNHATAHWNRALCLLAAGKLEEGFEEYEWRIPRFPGTHNRYRYPRWQGEPLEGKTILVYAEQGVGDEILFANCIPDLIAAAGRVVIQCDPRLEALFARSFPQATVHGGPRDEGTAWIASLPLPPSGEVPPVVPALPLRERAGVRGISIDYQVAAGSLPRFFRKRIEDFPKYEDGYLKPDPARVEHWKRRLSELGEGAKVGICWRSGLSSARRDVGYTAIDEWGPVFAVPGVRFVNLQYDDCGAELVHAREKFGVEIVNFGGTEIDLKNDLDECAALYKALDIVAAPGTAVSALAGGVGVETCFVGWSGWTQLGAQSFPWYPSFRSMRRENLPGGNEESKKMVLNAFCLAGLVYPLAGCRDTWLGMLEHWYEITPAVVDLGLFFIQRNESRLPPGFVEGLNQIEVGKSRRTPAGEVALAELLARCGRMRDAEECVRRAYEMDSNLQDGYGRIGWLATEGMDWSGADSMMGKDYEAGRLGPAWKLIYAWVRARNGCLDDAISLVEDAYSEDTTVCDGYGRLGWAGYLLGKDKDFMRQYLDKDIGLGRFSTAGIFYRALYRTLTGAVDEAVSDVESVYAENFAQINWLTAVGWICVRKGDARRGCELMERDSKAGRMLKSWEGSFSFVLALCGRRDEALAILRKSADVRVCTDMRVLGFPFSPDAVLTVSQLEEIISRDQADINGFVYVDDVCTRPRG